MTHHRHDCKTQVVSEKSPGEGKIACFVVVGEVAKASHPDIACNEDSDGIVHLLGLKIMVQQKQDLQSDAHD